MDCGVLLSIEPGLDTAHPEHSAIPARVLGFGEISAVIAFDTLPAASGWVFKRLPIFNDEAEARAHETLTMRYVALLARETAIDAQDTPYQCVPAAPTLAVFYAMQRALPP